MSLRPKRKSNRAVETGEFEDPLKNYDKPDYDDELERSLAEDTVAVMQTTPITSVPPTMTIEEAMRIMVTQDIACLMVTEGDKLVGMFSERDMLSRVADQFEKLRDKPIKTVMTRDPVAVYETDSPAKALNVMATGGFRHVPVLDVDDKVVGILGPRRVTAYLEKYMQE